MQDLNSAPDGYETVYATAETFDPALNKQSRIATYGEINNHIYQRVARPYTYTGANEQYLYHEDASGYSLPDGRTFSAYKIYRSPNTHPASQPVTSGHPVLSEYLSEILDHSSETVSDERNSSFEVEIKLRNVPEYNIPLLPREEAGSKEIEEVLNKRSEALQTRRNTILNIALPVTNAIQNEGGTIKEIMTDIGWIRAEITPQILETLSLRTDIAVINDLLPDKTSDNSCVANCTPTLDYKWYLGDGASPSRLDYQEFYDKGYNGIIANNSFHGFGKLTIGIVEYGKLEDDGVFLLEANGFDRLRKRLHCHRYCTGIVIGSSCYFGSWKAACDEISNFNDDENSSSCHEKGCHGTGVAAIAAAKYTMQQSEDLNLGDACFYGTGDHCTSQNSVYDFYQYTKGMSEGYITYYRIKDDYDFVIGKAYESAKSDHVDVINMSHGPVGRDYDKKCKITINYSFEETLENAYDDGIFVVNSTGNFDQWGNDTSNGYTKDDCLTNSRASKPKVFAVAGLFNKPLHYSDRQSYWESGYVPYYYPQTADDYDKMRTDPLGSQTGGATVTINNTAYDRELSLTDLVAPVGGFGTTEDTGEYGEANDFFSGSSGAAPHVSGLAILVKHMFLANNQFWINYPGRLHTVMLAMGDRAIYKRTNHHFYYPFTNTNQDPQTYDNQRIYGFGRIKLRRLLGSGTSLAPVYWSMQTRIYTDGSSFPRTYRLWSSPFPNQTKFLKCVFFQAEDMSNKSNDDQVSDFKVSLIIGNANGNSCSSSPHTVRVFSNNYHDIKKFFAYESATLPGKCAYLKLEKRHITQEGITVHWFCYSARRNDHE